MRKYEEPTLEIQTFEMEDIMDASSGDGVDLPEHEFG